MSRRATFSQTDVTRVVKGALAAGLTIARIIARPDGVEIVTADAAPPEPVAGNDLDAEFSDWEARHGED